jgi:predicted small secreted protein
MDVLEKGKYLQGQDLRAAVTVLLLLLLSVWAAGCATMWGLGGDIQSLGRGIKQVFTQSLELRC